MAIFLASLAGIPPIGGWFAKFVIFRALVAAGHHLGLRAGRRRRRQLGDRGLLLLPRRARTCSWRSPSTATVTPIRVPVSLTIALVLTVVRHPGLRGVPRRRHPLHRHGEPRARPVGGRRRAEPRRSRPRWSTRIRPSGPDPVRPRSSSWPSTTPTTASTPAGGRAGRRGDFLTSPEVGPLFGAVMARALDAVVGRAGIARPLHRGRGRPPAPARMARVGAGRRAGLRPGAAPTCWSSGRRPCAAATATTCRWSTRPGVRARRRRRAGAGPPGGGPRTAGGVARAELPAVPITGVVLANELLDNLASACSSGAPTGWSEVYVGLGATESTGRATVTSAGPSSRSCCPASDHDARLADRLAPDAPVGARVPIQREASVWLAAALEPDRAGSGGGHRLRRRPPPDGRAAAWPSGCAPTGATRAGGVPARRPRRAGRHLRGGRRPARRACARRAGSSTQADFLAAHGIEVLVEEGRRIWRERAHVGDLAAVRARSRVGEGEALLDPAGLGGFECSSGRSS